MQPLLQVFQMLFGSNYKIRDSFLADFLEPLLHLVTFSDPRHFGKSASFSVWQSVTLHPNLIKSCRSCWAVGRNTDFPILPRHRHHGFPSGQKVVLQKNIQVPAEQTKLSNQQIGQHWRNNWRRSRNRWRSCQIAGIQRTTYRKSVQLIDCYNTLFVY